MYVRYFSEVRRVTSILQSFPSQIIRFVSSQTTSMMYPLEAIVLKKNRIDEHRWVISCFSSEYGKIDIFHGETKGSPKLDTLSHFTGRIMTKEKNTLSQIYTLDSFAPGETYEIYDIAGWSVSILYALLPH